MEKKKVKCEYLGCGMEAIAPTDAKECDGSTTQYMVCNDHVGQLDCIVLTGTSSN